MTRYIAFLRAINAGSGRTVKMACLRQIFEMLGFSGVATFIASGNVVFEAKSGNSKVLEKKIEKGLRHALGYQVAAFIRTEAEVAKIARYRPFRRAQVNAATEYNVIFLADKLADETQAQVKALATKTDEFRAHGREVYWLRCKKQNGSIFAHVPLEKTLGRRFTIRAVKTVKRLAVELRSATH
jgi:uncharacterized protein (DUF1697 family)